MPSASLYHEIRMQFKTTCDGHLVEHLVHHESVGMPALLRKCQQTFHSPPVLDLKIDDCRFTVRTLKVRNKDSPGEKLSIMVCKETSTSNNGANKIKEDHDFVCTHSAPCPCLKKNRIIAPKRATKLGRTPRREIDLAIHCCEMSFHSHISGVLFIESLGSHKSRNDIQKHPTWHSCCEEPLSMESLCWSSGMQLDFRQYFALILLTQPSSRVAPTGLRQKGLYTANLFLASEIAATQSYIESITNIFERELLFRAPEKDQWHQGQDWFRRKLAFYVEKRIEARFCLPAFPCKSSNDGKVASVWPDGAEYEALSNLHRFCAEVNTIYPPGCVMEIVSDGHVFSDCVGVDDDVVSEYTRKLHIMSTAIHKRLCEDGICQGTGSLTFQGLSDILFSNVWARTFFRSSFGKVEALSHPVRTKICVEDDRCRDILLQSCGASGKHLRKVIETDVRSSLTMLYRGFSRFMLDDLRTHPDGRDKSKSQRKKLAEKVALEMMQRNQAYSHLVELIMPRHIRLSIHAHNNAGPKFAVSLLPKDRFKPLTSFDGVRLASRDTQYDEKHHLHIPTPWHNCLVMVEGHSSTYVCKSELVKMELANNDSPWSARSGYLSNHPRGGRYVLQRRRGNSETRPGREG